MGRNRWSADGGGRVPNGRRVATVVAALGLTAGCAAATATSEPDVLEPLPGVPPPPSTEPVVPVTLDPTVAAIEACTELVRFGAFVGDPELSEWWDDVGHDEATLAAECEALAAEDPWEIHDMWERWNEVRAEFDAAP